MDLRPATAQLVQEAQPFSHFQRAVLKIGDYLIVLAVALVVLILAVALFRGDPVLTTLEFCLVLLVSTASRKHYGYCSL